MAQTCQYVMIFDRFLILRVGMMRVLILISQLEAAENNRYAKVIKTAMPAAAQRDVSMV